MVRNGEHFEVESLSEFGIFGTFLCRGNEVLINQASGHLVRTKVNKFFQNHLLHNGAACWHGVCDASSPQREQRGPVVAETMLKFRAFH